jgi:hypothetical protein
MVELTFIIPAGAPMRLIIKGVMTDRPPSPGDYVCMQGMNGKYIVTGMVTKGTGAGFTNCSFVRMPDKEAYYIPTGSTPTNPELSIGRAFVDANKITVSFDSPNADDCIVSIFDVNVRI